MERVGYTEGELLIDRVFIMFYFTNKFVVVFDQDVQWLTVTVYNKEGEEWETVAQDKYNLMTYSFRKAFKQLRKDYNI